MKNGVKALGVLNTAGADLRQLADNLTRTDAEVCICRQTVMMANAQLWVGISLLVTDAIDKMSAHTEMPPADNPIEHVVRVLMSAMSTHKDKRKGLRLNLNARDAGMDSDVVADVTIPPGDWTELGIEAVPAISTAAVSVIDRWFGLELNILGARVINMMFLANVPPSVFLLEETWKAYQKPWTVVFGRKKTVAIRLADWTALRQRLAQNGMADPASKLYARLQAIQRWTNSPYPEITPGETHMNAKACGDELIYFLKKCEESLDKTNEAEFTPLDREQRFNPDYYCPFRWYADSVRHAMSGLGSPFSPEKILTKEGMFGCAFFRQISFNSLSGREGMRDPKSLSELRRYLHNRPPEPVGDPRSKANRNGAKQSFASNGLALGVYFWRGPQMIPYVWDAAQTWEPWLNKLDHRPTWTEMVEYIANQPADWEEEEEDEPSEEQSECPPPPPPDTITDRTLRSRSPTRGEGGAGEVHGGTPRVVRERCTEGYPAVCGGNHGSPATRAAAHGRGMGKG